MRTALSGAVPNSCVELKVKFRFNSVTYNKTTFANLQPGPPKGRTSQTAIRSTTTQL